MSSAPVRLAPVADGSSPLVAQVVTLALLLLFVVALTLLGHDPELAVAAGLALRAGVHKFSR